MSTPMPATKMIALAARTRGAYREMPGLDLSSVAGVVCRNGDVASTRGVHWVAILFRITAGVLVLIMAAQVVSVLTGAVEISYGVLVAEVIRLIVFAGLLWGAGDLAERLVTAHCDLRATRILLARLARAVDQER